MKIALVHELLTMKGGAERVLKVLADIFPEAPIYTLLYDEKKLGDWFPASRVRPSKAQELSEYIGFNHHFFLPAFPKTIEAFDFSEFDLVISSSSAFAHGIITNGKPKHLSFINSPARYLWDRTHDVQSKMNPLARFYFSLIAHRLRVWDSEAAGRADMLLCSSKEVQRRIQLYWNRISDVLYPPIDDFWFEERPKTQDTRPKEPHFLIVSTLARYKNIDIAIEACNQLKLPLKIVGEGKDRRRLQSLAGPTVEFLGKLSDTELMTQYEQATATIFPGLEDFGLVPIESIACGTPVIAYRGGGALETIVEHETGTFFDAQNAASIAETLQKFDHKKYSSEKCRSQAAKFSKSNFEQQLHTHIGRLMQI